MKSKSIILLVLVIWGCGSIPKNYTAINGSFDTNISECETLIKEIQKKWAQHDSIHCFYLNTKLLKQIETNQNCFLKIDTISIIDLFGIPNRHNELYLGYNLSRNCIAGNDFYGEFVLNFNHKKGLIYKIDFKRVETVN